MINTNQKVNSKTFCITIVGSGVSTGVPVIGHLSNNCACAEAIREPQGPNKRNNVSLLITIPSINNNNNNNNNNNTNNNGGVKHILIDCGKTFRDAYFRVLVHHNIQQIDALLLTHDHADAMAGLDDLRDLQRMYIDKNDDWFVEHYIPTYTSVKTLHTIKEQVGYIFRNSREFGIAPQTQQQHEELLQKLLEDRNQAGLSNNIGTRRSTALDLFALSEDIPTPFYIPAIGSNFPIYSIPVEHGVGYIALGFVFGRGIAFHSTGASINSIHNHTCVVYLSDVSYIPEVAMKFLKDLVKIDILIIDLLGPSGMRTAPHFCQDDVVNLVKILQPHCTYGVGIHCELEHDSGNTSLREEIEKLKCDGGSHVNSIELAYDGQVLWIN